MQIFNLQNLNKWQEVPKIIYKPLSVTDSSIYFEKIVLGLEDSWSEGIWEYDKFSHVMNRLDKGHHAENVQLYDFDTPINYISSNVEGSLDKLYFTTITEVGDDDFIEFFEIDLESRIQRNILSFTFDKDAFLYKKMEILAPGYILFWLSYDLELADSDFFDSIYLLDVKEKKYYEILDDAFNINSGTRILTGETFKEQYLFIEEYYLSEEEQLEVLTSEEVELAFDLPGDLEPAQVHVNAIKGIKLSDFIDQVKNGEKYIDFDIIDELDQEGTIRLIGHSDKAIYYRKEYYEFILSQKNDFMSRRKIGRSEIYRVDMKTLEKSYLKDVDRGSTIIVNNDSIFEVIEFNDRSELLDLETHETRFTFKKTPFRDWKYEIVDFKNNEFLIVSMSSPTEEIGRAYHIVDVSTRETVITGSDILTVDNYIFVI